MIFFYLASAMALLLLVAASRVFLGPTTPDRVVGLDTSNTLMVGLLLVLAAFYRQEIFADVAIVYAMLSFVGTLFLAKYLEGKK